jgi:two-component system chemotaxis response regulator CheB
MSIKARGGVAIVQDPNEALSPEMPQNAIKHVRVDHILPLAKISSLIAKLAREPVGKEVVAMETKPIKERDRCLPARSATVPWWSLKGGA